LPLRRQQAIAELMAGDLIKHSFYVAPGPRKKPDPTDLACIPYFPAMFTGQANVYHYFHQMVNQTDKPIIQVQNQGRNAVLKRTPHLGELFQFMDGKRTTGEIFEAIATQQKSNGQPVPTPPELLKEFGMLYERLNYFQWLLLRHQGAATMKSPAEMQKRVSDLYAGA
jgi:hypothetical protein